MGGSDKATTASRTAAASALSTDVRTLNAIVESFGAAVVVVNGLGRATAANLAAESLTGLCTKSPDAQRWFERSDLFEVDGTTPFDRTQNPVALVLSGAAMRHTELCLDTPRLGRRWLSVTASRHPDEGAGAILIFRDISDQIRLRDDLRRSNGELEQFAYVASHDLQEPLRKISGFLELIAQENAGKLGEETDEYIGFAVDGARRMQTLIRELLALSRIRRADIEHRDVDLTALANSVRSDLALQIQEARATVTIEPLPWVRGHDSQLRQLLQNLIANAVKFRGERPPAVRIDAAVRGREWVLGVHDNGIGIPPAQRDRVFQVFTRLHARSAFPGSGIGLAMCRRIAELHGGRIWATSNEDEGSSFWVSMPASIVIGP